MHAERQAKGSETTGSRGRPTRPRVVVFELAGNVRVAVLELPETAGVGDRVRHDGRTWLIRGTRTGARVLIAEPESN
jgi:hypothetical protein